VQVPKVSHQVPLVLLSGHPVSARRHPGIQVIERQRQPCHADMVQQRGEPRILVLSATCRTRPSSLDTLSPALHRDLHERTTELRCAVRLAAMLPAQLFGNDDAELSPTNRPTRATMVLFVGTDRSCS
jgi:hypothetical protein